MKLPILFIILLTGNLLFGQIKKAPDNSYIYPYKAEVNFSVQYVNFFSEIPDTAIGLWTDYYFRNFLGDERYYYYNPLLGELNDEQKRNERKSGLIDKIRRIKIAFPESSMVKNSGLSEKKISNIYRHNPYAYFQVDDNPEILPCLDTLPDGNYTQYYKPFVIYDIEGNAKFIDNAVRSKFILIKNKLEGKIEYFNHKGEKYVQGNYSGGFKNGEFYIIEQPNSFGVYKSYYKYLKENDFQFQKSNDSTIYTFKNNLLDGKYEHYNTFFMKKPLQKGTYSKDKLIGAYYTAEYSTSKSDSIKYDIIYYPTEKIVVHQPVILSGPINSNFYERGSEGFEFPEDAIYLSLNLYELARPEKNESLEIEGENGSSYNNRSDYEYEEYYDYGEYGEYEDDYPIYGMDMYSEFDSRKGRLSYRERLQDSLGIIWSYDKEYILKDYDGELIYRTTFKDGYKQKGDTVFYPKMKPFIVVAYLENSNKYQKTVYDLNGKVYSVEQYDSLGHFDTLLVVPFTSEIYKLDGLEYTFEAYADQYQYYNSDTSFITSNQEMVLLDRSLNSFNKKVSSETIYYPREKKLIHNEYTLNNKLYATTEAVFGENFSYWNGYSNTKLGNLESRVLLSASERPKTYLRDADTNFHTRVSNLFWYYNLTFDSEIYRGNEKFSGDFKIQYGTRKFKISDSDDEIKISIPLSEKFAVKSFKEYEKFKEKGKISKKSILNDLSVPTLQQGYYPASITYFFSQSFSDLITSPYGVSQEALNYGDEYYDEYAGMNRKIKIEDHSAKVVKGQFSEGKPINSWQVVDYKERPLNQFSFINGELSGEAKQFELQQSIDLSYYYGEYGEDITDSLPKTPTLYLFSKSSYADGRLDGHYTTYDWLGNITGHTNYAKGYQQGKSFSRNKYSYAIMNYQDDELDGLVKVYFLRKDHDSLLMYDLNFQNGLLQGESKSYHTNGKLANRGFFLTGQPIDDYESYDSLGFKYQYVKFLYNQPVEEKVWELNELSVKYEFDWRDSLYFNPSDIVDISSVQHMMYELGLASGEEYYQPYYGRERLIEKGTAKYKLTKYFPNGEVARTGTIKNNKKVECWKTYDYYGKFLYEVNYFDTLISINESIQFKSKGIYYTYDSLNNLLSKSYIIEKREKYDCSHSDHYEMRQFYTIYQNPKDSVDRMNGYVLNFYDNGTRQSEGKMVKGLPTGVWKFYDAQGNLNEVGTYILGKRDGRWLGGDLSKTRFLGEICLNPNLPNLEEEIAYREKQLNIIITNYEMGKALNKEFFDVDLNKVVTED